MLRLIITVLSVVLCFVSAQSSASDLESRLLKCRSLSSVTARIECYDQITDSLAREDEAAEIDQVEDTQQAPVAASTTIAKPQPEPTQPAAPAEEIIQPEEFFGKPESAINEVAKKKLEIPSLNQIRSPVAKIQQNPAKEFVVLLENGQTWKQKGDGGAWRIKEGEVVVISKAFFGSFKMRVEGRSNSVRAVRVE